MTGSKLKLNPSKTGFLLIGTKLQCCCYSYNKTKNGSRVIFISGPALWNALPVRNAETILTFRNLPKSQLFDLSFPPGSSAARLPVDEPALALIMTYNPAKDLTD